MERVSCADLAQKSHMATHQRHKGETMSTKRIERILECYEELGENEKEVLLTFVNRLRNGQKAFGKLYLGKKRWSWEAYEEALDLAVYAACGMNEEQGKMVDKDALVQSIF